MATLGLAATKSSFGLLTDPAAVSKATYTVFLSAVLLQRERSSAQNISPRTNALAR
jgi:hypothetical protein